MSDQIAFLFEKLWYHGSLGNNGSFDLGEFFLYPEDRFVENANIWDYYKNYCNNCEIIDPDSTLKKIKCKGHPMTTPYNLLMPSQLIGINESNAKCDSNFLSFN